MWFDCGVRVCFAVLAHLHANERERVPRRRQRLFGHEAREDLAQRRGTTTTSSAGVGEAAAKVQSSNGEERELPRRVLARDALLLLRGQGQEEQREEKQPGGEAWRGEAVRRQLRSHDRRPRPHQHPRRRRWQGRDRRRRRRSVPRRQASFALRYQGQELYLGEVLGHELWHVPGQRYSTWLI